MQLQLQFIHMFTSQELAVTMHAQGEELLAEASEDEEAGEGMKESQKYATFWKEFGRTIKLGVIEDAPNRPRLAKLLRVHTSAVRHPAHSLSRRGTLLDWGCREHMENWNRGRAQCFIRFWCSCATLCVSRPSAMGHPAEVAWPRHTAELRHGRGDLVGMSRAWKGAAPQ